MSTGLSVILGRAGKDNGGRWENPWIVVLVFKAGSHGACAVLKSAMQLRRDNLELQILLFPPSWC